MEDEPIRTPCFRDRLSEFSSFNFDRVSCSWIMTLSNLILSCEEYDVAHLVVVVVVDISHVPPLFDAFLFELGRGKRMKDFD